MQIEIEHENDNSITVLTLTKPINVQLLRGCGNINKVNWSYQFKVVDINTMIQHYRRLSV